MKKEFFFILLFCGVGSLSYAQDFIDINIDSIYCQDISCHLLNIDDESIYDCDIINLEIGADRYSYAIECAFSHLTDSPDIKENNLQLQKIKSLDTFTNWVEKQRFYSEYEVKDKTKAQLVQPINSRYIAITTLNHLPKNNSWHGSRENVYEVVPIRINNSYFIGGLVELEFQDIDYLLLPTKDGLGKLVNNHLNYSHTNRSEPFQSDYKRDILDSFRKRKKNEKYVLTNSISDSPILDGFYDELKLISPFIITSNNDEVSIYNFALEQLDLPNLKAAYGNYGSLQTIINNKIKWLTLEGEVSDTLLKPQTIGRCGNGPCLQKSIYKSEDRFFEVITDCSLSFNNKLNKKDTFEFNIGLKLKDVKYLNNTPNNTFYGYCHNQYFCQDDNLYYFKDKNGKEGVFRRIDEKEEKLQKLLNDKGLLVNARRPEYLELRKSLKRSYRDEIIFLGNYEEFMLQGYEQPIVFKQRGLYGIYPQMQTPKYTSLGPFVGNLAEFTLKSGDEGWIDLYGKEILKHPIINSK